MLIDDSEIDAFINQKMIQNYGFANRVYVFHNCDKALTLFHNFIRMPDLPKSLLPNIVFLDLNMPEKDGFGFLEDFMKLPKTIIQNVKIVFITSSNSENDIERSKKYVHVFAFITKPLTFLKLEEIQQLLLT